MTFRVLRANGSDAHQWEESLLRLPAVMRDLHYFPAYGAIYRDCYEHEPLCAVYERGACVVLQAFLRRPLDGLPFLEHAGAGHGYTDIATPYGFGGPLASSPNEREVQECLQAFDTQFCAWCRAEGIASEFVCLHPLLGNDAPIAASRIAAPKPAKEVIVIDLAPSEATLWQAISRGTRSGIQRARREGLSVEQVEPNDDALARFRELYLATMSRRGAAERWYFPQSYFSDCVRHLGRDRSALFFARYGGEVAAAYLLLNDASTAYYHFGASDERWLAYRPNNLLMYETMLWAKRRGLKRYHLGGGVTADGTDTLLRFKSSFGGSRAMLYTYGRIMNEDVYRQLCTLKLSHEQTHERPTDRPDYFPFYRR
jgi:serine/alanine adding enzyme